MKPAWQNCHQLALRRPGFSARLWTLHCRVVLVAAGLIAVDSSHARAQSHAPAVDTTITVGASSSTLEFNPTEIVARQGARVKLRFVNAGTLPHNFVLVRNEDDIDDLAMAAMSEGGDYVPKHLRDKMVAFTTLASPNQTVEVTFVVPPAGSYTYVCLMSGHAAMMLGKLRSRP
jgi:plastocyanin